MNKNILIILLVFVAGYALGVVYPIEISRKYHNQLQQTEQHNYPIKTRSSNDYEHQSGNYERQSNNNEPKNAPIASGEVPQKALDVLDYVLKNHEAPDGVVGGRKFKNLEQQLPKTTSDGQRINYQEWDVNEKHEGQNRGTERLVTGDDGSAYYTNNHYQSFKKIK